MTNTQEKILEVFKEHKVSRNGVLKPQSINIRSWDRRSQDEFENEIKQLIEDEYIFIKDSWYVLTDKGCDYIYRNYSIETTKSLILEVFKKHKIGIDEIIMQNSFIKLQQSVDRFHFDNFTLAFQNLISDEYIEIAGNNCYKLTKLGYDNIY